MVAVALPMAFHPCLSLFSLLPPLSPSAIPAGPLPSLTSDEAAPPAEKHLRPITAPLPEEAALGTSFSFPMAPTGSGASAVLGPIHQLSSHRLSSHRLEGQREEEESESDEEEVRGTRGGRGLKSGAPSAKILL